jgi:adenylate cyclase
MAGEAGFLELKAKQATFLEAYRAQGWAAAETALKALEPLAPSFGLDKLVSLYAERLKTFRAHPPTADWDGVYEATEK